MMYPDHENMSLEFKERMTHSLMKTISAYANYHDGKIIIGIKDDGTIIGVEDVQATRLSLENAINDNITPRPDYEIREILVGHLKIIELDVRRGKNVPYLFKGQAYRRMDTATTQVDENELFNLMLQKRNLTYDATDSNHQELEFKILERFLQEKLGITQFDKNVMITLGLLKDSKFNIAAELLSDQNSHANASTDIVRFGTTTSIILDQNRLENVSALIQYQKAVEMFQLYYKPFQIIEGFERVSKVRIPDAAFREAVANAIVHRDYRMGGSIQIAMFDDRIDITSPGGLPNGITKENYLNDLISMPRNQILANVFYRLGIIELFGTGVLRIKDAYAGSEEKPIFKIDESRICITLPVLHMPEKMTEEDKVLSFLAKYQEINRSKVEKKIGLSRSQAYELLTRLVEEGKIMRVGSGPATKYRLV
ncbi:MAG TPA: AAA family ATPase [Clostridiales bacterium]|nr:AAA family ATPase [Clostridiales bacterium]